jgi:hypothetical protein
MCSKPEEAWIMAARCAERAEASFSDDGKELLILQRDCWIKLANKLEFTEWAKGASRREIPR